MLETKFKVVAPVNVPVPTINLSVLSSQPTNALSESPLSNTIPMSLPGVPVVPLPNSISLSVIVELVVASVVVVPLTVKFPVITALPPTVTLLLNEAAPAATDTGYFRSTRPSSTVLTLGTYNSNNGSSDNLIAYCFAEKQGYSKFGSYKSNGSEDGPFVYTGFKPAMIIAHRSSNNNKQWLIKDNARNPSNEVDFNLYPNSGSAETNTNVRHEIDFLSNGFKIRDQYDLNQAGGTFIYMAWAENPFVTSTGVPTTAR